MHVSPETLYRRWEELARLRDCGFRWEGSSYGKPSRSLSSDEEGLAKHAPGLLALLGLAPTGFPAQASVRDALVKLHSQHAVFDCDSRMVLRYASEAADVWRIMCRDCYELKKKKCRNPTLQSLMDLIELPARSSSSADLDVACASSAPDTLVDDDNSSGALNAVDVLSLFPSFADFDHDAASGDDIEITGMTCTCEHCIGGAAGALVEIEDDNATSPQISGPAPHIPIPDARLGAQRKETLGAANGRRLRMKKKTTPKEKDGMKKKKNSSNTTSHVKKTASRRESKDQHRQLKLPISIVTRKGNARRAFEMYIMDQDGYVCGMTSKSGHKQFDQKLAALIYKCACDINTGLVSTVHGARVCVSDTREF